MVCTPHKVLMDDLIQKNELGGVCSMHGGQETRMVLGSETQGQRTVWKSPV